MFQYIEKERDRETKFPTRGRRPYWARSYPMNNSFRVLVIYEVVLSSLAALPCIPAQAPKPTQKKKKLNCFIGSENQKQGSKGKLRTKNRPAGPFLPTQLRNY